MLKEALEYLISLSQDPVTIVDGIPRWTKTGTPVGPPLPVGLLFPTLSALVGYIKSDLDTRGAGPEPGEENALVVAGPGEVNLIGDADPKFKTRATYACAALSLTGTKFGVYMDQVAFSLYLQTGFVRTKEVDALLALAGDLDLEDVRTSRDDGVTQTASARRGVVLREKKIIPNPVVLRPYRTFREIEQPESAFVFRVQEGRTNADSHGPVFALFPADGDAWSLKACADIKEWLAKELGEHSPPIFA